jgi:hypothetical protein
MTLQKLLMSEFGSKVNYHKKKLLNEMFWNLFNISLISHQLCDYNC